MGMVTTMRLELVPAGPIPASNGVFPGGRLGK